MDPERTGEYWKKSFQLKRLPSYAWLDGNNAITDVKKLVEEKQTLYMVVDRETKTYQVVIILGDGRLRYDRLAFGTAYEIIGTNQQFKVSQTRETGQTLLRFDFNKTL